MEDTLRQFLAVYEESCSFFEGNLTMGMQHLEQTAVCHWECCNTVRIGNNKISMVGSG